MRRGMLLSYMMFFLLLSFQEVDLFGDEELDRELKSFLQINPEILPSDLSPLGKKALPLLIEKLQDEKSSESRWRAAIILSFLGGDAKGSIPILIKALDDSNQYVRRDAIDALIKIDPDNDEVFDALSKKMDDPDQNVRYDIILRISFYGEKILPKLKEILAGDRDEFMRRTAASVMGMWQFREAMDEMAPLLRNALKSDSSPRVRYFAARALANAEGIADEETFHLALDVILHDEDAEVRSKAVDILYSARKISKRAVAPYFERLSNKAIAGDSKERKNALDAIFQLKQFSRDFVSLLSKARDPHDRAMTQRISEIVSKLPQGLLETDPWLLIKLKQLTSPDRELQRAAVKSLEEMRIGLNDEEDDELRDLVKKELVKKRADSVCTLLCKLYTNPYTWLSTGLEEKSGSLHFALISLRRLFLLKGAPFCPKQELSPMLLSTIEKKEIAAVICEGGDPFQQAKELASPFLKPGRPEGAYDVYGKLFHLLVLKELLRSETDERKKEEINKEIKKASNLLERDTHIANQLLMSHLGSLFHSSLISASVLAAPTVKGIAFVANTIDPGDPLSIKYALDRRYAHPKASIGRAVQANLVMYQSDPKNKTFRDNLMYALSFYRDQFPFLMMHLRSRMPHVGIYQLASYYLYPSVPYATAAVTLLLRTSSGGEKEELLRIKEDLKEMLLSLIQEDGLFQPDGFMSGYENAMAGLALLPLAEEECQPDKTKPSLGILTEE